MPRCAWRTGVAALTSSAAARPTQSPIFMRSWKPRATNTPFGCRPAHAGAARYGQAMIDDHPARLAGEDWRPDGAREVANSTAKPGNKRRQCGTPFLGSPRALTEGLRWSSLRSKGRLSGKCRGIPDRGAPAKPDLLRMESGLDHRSRQCAVGRLPPRGNRAEERLDPNLTCPNVAIAVAFVAVPAGRR